VATYLYLAGLLQHVSVGETHRMANLVSFPQDCHVVATSFVDMLVERIVADVRVPSFEPLQEPIRE
jgi:hypothetical protein